MPNVTFNFRTANAASVRRELQRTLDATREGQRAVQGQSQQAAQRSAAAEQAATQKILAESAKRAKARADEAAKIKKQEEQVTAAMLAEDRKRTTAFTAGQKERLRAMQQYASTVAREERKATQEHAREQQRRTRTEQQAQRDRANALRDRSSAWGSRASQFASYAMGTGSALHGQIQDARRTRAEQMRHLGIAFTQANVGAAEQSTRRAQLIAFADTNRMDVSELARAAEMQQVSYSSFSNRDTDPTDAEGARRARDTRFERFLSTAVLARNTGNAVAETTQLQGLLSEAGFDTDMQDRLVRDTLGMGNRGAVATQAIVRQGSGPLKARMSLALSRLAPGASPEDRINAAANEYRQTVAEMQVEQTTGAGPRLSSNALSAANREIANPLVQRRMLTNIRNSEVLTAAQRTRLERTMFERGPGGHSQLRGEYRDMLHFTAGFGGVVGNNGAAFASTFRGSGGGNQQSLQKNWRDMGANLLNPNLESGRSGADAVRDLMGATITQQQIDLGAETLGNDDLSRLLQEEGRRVTALTDNTSALVRLSNALAGFQASNPMLSTALGAGAGALLPALGSLAGSAAGGTAVAGTAAAAATAGAAAAATTAAALGMGAIAAYGPGGMLNDAVEGASIGRNANGSAQDQVRSVFDAGMFSSFIQEVRALPGVISAAFQSAPQGSTHAANVAALEATHRATRDGTR